MYDSLLSIKVLLLLLVHVLTLDTENAHDPKTKCSMYSLCRFSFILIDRLRFLKGTPGTGKTTLGQELAQRVDLNYINVGDVAKENECFESWDAEYQCHVLNEDKVVDHII